MNQTIQIYINEHESGQLKPNRISIHAELIEQRKYTSLVKLEDGNIIVRKNRDIVKGN